MPYHRRVRQCRVVLCCNKPVAALVFALANLCSPGAGTAWRGTSTSIMFLSRSEGGVINIARPNLFQHADDNRRGIKASHNSKPDCFFMTSFRVFICRGVCSCRLQNVVLRSRIFKRLRAECIEAVFIRQYFTRGRLFVLLCKNNIIGSFIRISLLKITACNGYWFCFIRVNPYITGCLPKIKSIKITKKWKSGRPQADPLVEEKDP